MSDHAGSARLFAMKEETQLIFKALSHPQRLLATVYLGRKARTNDELVRLLKTSVGNVHAHILQLRDRNLIDTQRYGKQVKHTLNHEVLRNALRELAKEARVEL